MGFTIAPVERDSTVVTVPEDVSKSLEEAWAYLQEHPGYVFLATFEDETEESEDEKDENGDPLVVVTKSAAEQLATFRKQATHYLATREGGALVHEKIRTDGLGDGAMRFTIMRPEDRTKRGRGAPSAQAKAQPKPGPRAGRAGNTRKA